MKLVKYQAHPGSPAFYRYMSIAKAIVTVSVSLQRNAPNETSIYLFRLESRREA